MTNDQLQQFTRDTEPSEISFLAVCQEPEVRNQVAAPLIARGFPGESCADTAQALTLLEQKPFQVALCDVNVPGIGAFGLLEQVQSRFPDTAFVMAVDFEEAFDVAAAVRAGVADYVVKPPHPETLVARVRRAVEVRYRERALEKHRSRLEEIVRQRAQQLGRARERIERTCDETLRALGYALDLRDNETAGHSQRVTRYCLELAKAMHCSSDELKTIVRGAYLHDIGKIGVPDAILRKPAELTEIERGIMEAHVRIGYEMIRRISFLGAPAEIVLAHQERFDGAGYPRGLAGDEIPLGARIFAVADTLDAMTRNRPYRRAVPFSVARAEIIRESGRQFDPKVVEAFLSLPQELWESIRDEVKSQQEGPDPYWWIHPSAGL